ncbi:MAG: aspartyl protease family protein, partial [Candidatus Portnoybacteria bacterium]|nr:aspartyl protease family protein [Candidatus Portnoybacteria bacterium]
MFPRRIVSCYLLIVDTGADYTVLPHSASFDLGINVKKDCKQYYTSGIGGREVIYFTQKIQVKLGTREIKIPLGFLNRDDIPPLLGRYQCL